MYWRSRLSRSVLLQEFPRAPPVLTRKMRDGTKTTSSRSSSVRIPIATSRAKPSTKFSPCFPKALPRNADVTAPTCIMTASTASCARAAERVLRPLPAAARFPTMPCSPWWPNPMAAPSEPWMKILPSRAWPATSCCSATLRGASVEWKRRLRACWSKTRTVRRPTCLSGEEKLPRARLNFPSSWAICARRSATACPA